MADATDSKSVARKGVWVQVPPPAFGTWQEFEMTPAATAFAVRGRNESDR